MPTVQHPSSRAPSHRLAFVSGELAGLVLSGGVTLRPLDKSSHIEGSDFANPTASADLLARLPKGHPSEPGYARERPGAGDLKPLTDAEFGEHLDVVRAGLADAFKVREGTHHLYSFGGSGKVWLPERAALHGDIIRALYGKSGATRGDGAAVMAGGLPGSGKSTVLTSADGMDPGRYLLINPDVIKHEMAARGMLPDLRGLSPMEASTLAHEEASYIAKQLALRAYADRRNVVWDVTMSSAVSTQRRIGELRTAGYTHVEGVFVAVPVELSVERAASRHRAGHEEYRAGYGLGGRYTAPELIRSHADPVFGSTNRAAFELVKWRFDAWRVYDNSATGRPAVLTDAFTPRGQSHERNH